MNDTVTTQEKVCRCLDRLGYTGIEVTDSGGGRMVLAGRAETPNDRAVILATTRCVMGVTQVKSKIKVTRPRNGEHGRPNL